MGSVVAHLIYPERPSPRLGCGAFSLRCLCNILSGAYEITKPKEVFTHQPSKDQEEQPVWAIIPVKDVVGAPWALESRGKGDVLFAGKGQEGATGMVGGAVEKAHLGGDAIQHGHERCYDGQSSRRNDHQCAKSPLDDLVSISTAPSRGTVGG